MEKERNHLILLKFVKKPGSYVILSHVFLQDCFKIRKVLDASERFLMADLRAEVEKLFIKIISKDNIKELCGAAHNYCSKKLVRACAVFMVKNGICLDEEEVKQMPDVAAACLKAYQIELV